MPRPIRLTVTRDPAGQLPEVHLPGRVVRSSRSVCEIRELRPRSWYDSTEVLTVTNDPTAYTFEFLFLPRPAPKRRPPAYRRVAEHIGAIRYGDAPAALAYFEARTIADLLHPSGAAPRSRLLDQPYAPEGPWEYVPPEHPFDWRTRARRRLPKELLPRKTGFEDLLTFLLWRASPPYEVAQLRLRYEP